MSFLSIKVHSIRFKLIASLITVSLLIGLISLLEGGNLLYQSVLDEANNRIQQDLNVARVIYDERVNSVRMALSITASSPGFGRALAFNGQKVLFETLKELNSRVKLDFLELMDVSGRVIYRYRQKEAGQTHFLSTNPLMLRALEDHRTVAGTVVLTPQMLQAEYPLLVEKAKIATPNLNNNGKGPFYPDAAALTIGAAAPVFLDNLPVGFICGGYLLNKDIGIVDKIGETVFRNESYKGRKVGTATIFHHDLRIATSVKDSDGRRAVGTKVSPQVAKRVLGEGEKWTARAKVLNDWYITAYEPITDILGKRVGMLYVGVLEAKYWDVRKRALVVFTVITLTGVIVAIVLGWLFTGRIMRPVSYLIRASAQIKKGNFSPYIGPISGDDIGQLQKKFLVMTQALKEREERQKAESEIRLIQSEKQASVGKLAAGVAHEINNPLTAVLTFTHLLLRRKDLVDDVRSDLTIIASQTERVRGIVKSLLDFSRQTKLNPEAMDINQLIQASVKLMENQALIKGLDLSFQKDENLPVFTLDRNQFQSVLINMIINAMDATPSGGKIEVQAQKCYKEEGSGVEIIIADNGKGILPEHMEKLFDPFFTTKEVGKGTGLGLAVSAGIIQRHGGTITVHSKPDAGTTFTIWLPQLALDARTETDTAAGNNDHESFNC